ncbi:EAL domain-containing protein [Marinibactrum halimedae]|uniref:bifunctional diguanylate cyclase/phosphodiesterase n=1 Tax=Marinibactrum halimedae TaxID=1444977 RepID=UPI001E2CE245|nr:EAL domain-containing protein [Marinibactrum halimedae]MCD9459618.1 EAL domain-containing protein [Marinibactrum halimedae]
MTLTEDKRKNFLSLKWQAVIVVSVVLFSAISLLTYFGKKNLDITHINERNRVFEDRQQAVNGALAGIQLQLLRLASHMQDQAQQDSDTTMSTQARLISVLEKNWGQLNFDWGVDSLLLVDDHNASLASWGNKVDPAQIPEQWKSTVKSSESPVTRVWCPTTCLQVVIVPVLLDNLELGLLILTSSLADAVLQFQANTNADIGLLVPSQASQTRSGRRSLERWSHDVVALTGIPLTHNLLLSVASNWSLEELLEQKKVTRVWDGNTYEIGIIPLSDNKESSSANLVVLDDITSDIQNLTNTLRTFIAAAIATLILTEAVVLASLWVPMVRLQVLSKGLPQLASSGRTKTAERLDKPSGRFLRNEIHELFDAATLLAGTLDRLDETVKSRTKRLKTRSRELLEERNFVTSLLNNVHVVIFTQSPDGDIQLINSEGRALLGLKEDQEHHENFLSRLDDVTQQLIRDGIRQLINGDLHEFHHELDFKSPHGRQLHMDWYHSCLNPADPKRSAILSVGLDLTERKQAEKNLAWLAEHDPLTELLNRRRFQLEFERALKQHQRNQEPGALIFFDIDQFKSINDTSGHMAGDYLLQEISQKLRHDIQETDVIARLGGDEFAILLEQSDRSSAIAFATKLSEIIRHTKISANGSTHKISVSIGISLYPDHGIAAEDLMANADLAMFKAKASSNARTNWQIFSPEDRERNKLRNTVNWKSRLQEALDADRLILHYQPIYDIARGRISHFEALVRMIDEKDEIISPGVFIPIAEKTGLICEIDSRVVTLACKALHKFKKQGFQEVTLAVNLSARAIADRNFIDHIEYEVGKYNIDRSNLIFELTETSAVEDINTAAHVIGDFRALGYRFALDDFGVGFASWYYLRQLPVDFVKIDGSFVRNLASDREDKLFVKALTDVVHGLGKQSIAEFVETPFQLSLLKELGVGYAQGYYIGKPKPHLVTVIENQTPYLEPVSGIAKR